MIRFLTRSVLVALTIAFVVPHQTAVNAQALTQEFLDLGYQLEVLGPITGLPAPYGGLSIKASEPDVLYIAGASFSANGVIHTVPLTRDPGTGRITGFSGPSSLFAAAPNVDGTVLFADNGTLIYTRFPSNALGQILPNGTTLTVGLTDSGVQPSPGCMAFVPQGMPGAGGLVLASYTVNKIMNVPYTFDAQGFLQPGWSGPPITLTVCNGPEGIIHVPAGSPGFAVHSMIMGCYDSGFLLIWDVDAQGLPILASGRSFIAPAPYTSGTAFDPVTGDLLFSTNGNPSRLVRVSGFNNTTGIGETSAGPLFELFPNPSDGLVRVKLNEPAADARLEVFDPTGALVHEALLGGAMDQVVDLRTGRSGLYLVRLSGQGRSAVERVVVE